MKRTMTRRPPLAKWKFIGATCPGPRLLGAGVGGGGGVGVGYSCDHDTQEAGITAAGCNNWALNKIIGSRVFFFLNI